jgi:lysozyme
LIPLDMPVQTYSPALVEFIRPTEGLKLTVYCCSGGKLTQGYGHTGGVTKASPPITREQAEKWLIEDLDKAAAIVRRKVKVPLTQGQFDAMTSFVFNNKLREFYNSTMLRLLNAGDYAGAAAQLPRWCKVVKPDGTVKVEPGLVTRRAKEREMFEGD